MAGTADLTPERERSAEALEVERIHGDHAPAFIAARIGALASAGDEPGVQRWREIADRFDRLQCRGFNC
ncbi:DUF6961 family protein [Sphingomonas sp. PB4P5]|uniref:DUF6961 family protein n=1 Tax=Parasphingomonas puruogangriensis TaxID=3096155 RepID=UPI002FC7D14E